MRQPTIRIGRLTAFGTSTWVVEAVWPDYPFTCTLGFHDTEAEALNYARSWTEGSGLELETAEILPFRKAVA